MGAKRSDIHAAYGCSACHDVVDGRTRVERWSLGDTSPDCKQEIHEMHLEGVIRTQEIMLREGLIRI